MRPFDFWGWTNLIFGLVVETLLLWLSKVGVTLF